MTDITVRPSSSVYFRDLAGGSLFDMATALVPVELGASLADDDDASFVSIVGSVANFGADRRGTVACVDFDPIPDLVIDETATRFPLNISIRVERVPHSRSPSARLWGLVRQGVDEMVASALYDYTEVLPTFSSDWNDVPDTPTWLTHTFVSGFPTAAADIIRTEGFTFATTVYDDFYNYATTGDVEHFRVFEVALAFPVASAPAPFVPPSAAHPSLRMLQRGGAGGMSGIWRMLGNPTTRDSLRRGPGSIL